MDMAGAPEGVLNENVTIEFIARSEITKSTNPLGIDWMLKRYTLYYGVRLEKRKHKPDKLVFLERPSKNARIFSHPVVHTTNGILFKTTFPPYKKKCQSYQVIKTKTRDGP